MSRYLKILILAISISVAFPVSGYADEIFRVRMYFGLSFPQGGSVSLDEWNDFQNNQIARTFEGFNIVDSIGYYKGKAERSKIVTLICKGKEMSKVKALAKSYAKRFHQDSVMLVVVPVSEWSFVEP